MADLTCPSCRAVISEDGEKVLKRSPRIKRMDDLEEELKDARSRLEKLEKGGSRGTRKPDADESSDEW